MVKELFLGPESVLKERPRPEIGSGALLEVLRENEIKLKFENKGLKLLVEGMEARLKKLREGVEAVLGVFVKVLMAYDQFSMIEFLPRILNLVSV